MANNSPDTDGDIVDHRRGCAPTLEKMLAGAYARRCVVPFLTGAPKAIECPACFRIIYAGEEIKCSISHCQVVFHLYCAEKDAPKYFVAGWFTCPQHSCMVCKEKESFWRCNLCTVAAHTKCAPRPVIDLKDDRAICWRHPSDWLLQNKKADFTDSIEEVFCRLPLPYVHEDFDSTISDFVAAVCRPPPYTYISRNVYLIKKKHIGVHVDTRCTCKADSACKEDCECRALLMSCSKNCRCSCLCTNRPFFKDKQIKIVKTKQGGRRVVALEPMEKGDFVMEYVGEVIDDATREQRLWDIRKRGEKNFHMCEISKDFTIDATFRGNLSRFLNHSCKPNCKLEKWQVDGETRVGVFTSHSIKVGEPLTYDFRTLRRHKPSFHPLDLICEAIGISSHDASVGARAQLVACDGEEQNILNSLQKMVDVGRQGLDHELEQDLCGESLNVPTNDADQQAQRSDDHVTERPLSARNGLKKHKAIAEVPCIEETGSVHPECRSAQANVSKQSHDASVGARAQFVACDGEEQNNMNSLQKMVDVGRQGLDHELEQDLCGESLNVSTNDADQQAQRSDDHVTERPLSAWNGLKKHKAIAEVPCIEETGSVHPECRSTQANVSKQSHDASVGARAQLVACDGEEQNNMNSLQKMVDVGRQGLDHELEQDLCGEPLNVSTNDADQQAQRSDDHVTERPLSAWNGLKKHKAIAEVPCIEETRSVHPECRCAQANVSKQEANEGKGYSISRCLDVLEAMDDVPDGMKILASDVFRDATNREMFLCYAPRLRGPWLKRELEKLHGSRQG